MTKVIGMIGKAYSGKSSAANIISGFLDEKSKKCCIKPFAKPLKDFAYSFGWDGRKDAKGRKFLQILGTEIGRCYDDEFWVKQWEKSIENLDVVLVDDVRFPNEAEKIKSLGGLLIKINSSEEVRKNRAEKKGEELPQKHPSENFFDNLPFDIEVDSDGSLDELEQELLQYKEKIIKD